MGRGGQEVEALRSPLRRRGGACQRRWADDLLEQELRAFVAGGSDWPTVRRLRQAGRDDLVEAVRDLGGARYWAARLGLRVQPRQDRWPRPEPELVAEAEGLIRQLGELPGIGRLYQLGHPKLAALVRRSGGRVRFCAKFSLKLPPG